MALALVAVGGARAQSTAGISISVTTDHKPTGGLVITSYGKPARVAGTVATRAGGVALVLQASTFKKSGFTTVGHARTTAGGAYVFVARPTLATRYRVALVGNASSASPTVTVYVGSRNTENFGCANGPVCNLHVTDVSVYPPSVAAQEGAKTTYFYVGVVSGSGTPPRIKLVSTGPQHRVGGNRYRVEFDYSFPTPGPYRYSWVTCTRDTEGSDGYGLPGHHHCGDRTIAYPSYTHWTG
jgi:hypothetical protein